MDKFDGFTEEEIRSLTSGKDRKAYSSTAFKKVTRHKNRMPINNVARERLLKNIIYDSNESIPKQARLNIPQVVQEEEENEAEEDKEKRSDKVEEKIKKTQVKIEETEQENKVQCVLNSERGIESLEEFEARQKIIEEENRQRKELLKKALADRTKKTREEVRRLNEIEGELKKLDLLLSNDVAIIRSQIESASFDFMEAQKRYDRAEKEFLDAKLDMFNKKERKELLTSHLCTIIEQNEMRKAKKLSDLMVQLEIGSKSSMLTSQIKVSNSSEVLKTADAKETKVNKKEVKNKTDKEDELSQKS